MSPLGFAACQSKKCTNRAEGTNRAMTHATEIILPQIAQIYTDSLGRGKSHRTHRIHRTPKTQHLCASVKSVGGHPLQVCSVNSVNSVGEHPLPVCSVNSEFCGRTSLPVCSVNSVKSVGEQIFPRNTQNNLLGWCSRDCCTPWNKKRL